MKIENGISRTSNFKNAAHHVAEGNPGEPGRKRICGAGSGSEGEKEHEEDVRKSETQKQNGDFGFGRHRDDACRLKAGLRRGNCPNDLEQLWSHGRLERLVGLV